MSGVLRLGRMYYDRRVKDHRTSHETRNTDAVLNGDINGFLKAFLMWHPEEKN